MDRPPLDKAERKPPAARIRKAALRDLKVLNDLAVRSEAYWGFDERHMKTFERTCAIKEAHFNKGAIFVVEKDGRIAGFYCLVRKEAGFELEHFYIDPPHIGQGLGRALWRHMRTLCIRRGIKEITMICSDFVKDFYLKMGASYLGQVESTVDRGTMIARLIYRIDPVAQKQQEGTT